MGVLIDSSVLVDSERADQDPRRFLDLPAAVSVITISELLHGARRADTPERRARREAFVESVTTLLPVIDFDLPVARLYASLWAETAAKGTPVGAHDLMIAATAQLLDWPVWARNRADFRRIPGTRLVDDG
ncbi:MAG: PIN domain-containing protein [Actinomycetota bacterium]|nr:PIN domain-containing protein [Euzebyaceae bacterium]MDQ3432868.1 PIN domain-containing protein [Actinomycetota bacterium]